MSKRLLEARFPTEESAGERGPLHPGKIPLWQWPNILSLDAAMVAVLWHLLLRRAVGLPLNTAEPLVLGFSVWVIYTFDHLLDIRKPPSGHEPLRKAALRTYKLPLTVAGTGGLLLLGTLIARELPVYTLAAGSILGFLVLSYFSAVHLTPARSRFRWPREAVVAALFTAGVLLPIWIAPAVQRSVLGWCALLLFLLCWLNCCAAEVWDIPEDGSFDCARQPHQSTCWISKHMQAAAGGIIVLSTLLTRVGLPVGLFVTVALSSGAMLLIESRKYQISVQPRCALIDIALCAPLPVVFFWQA